MYRTVCLFMISSITTALESSNITAIKIGNSEKDLYDKLFRNYNKWIRNGLNYQFKMFNFFSSKNLSD